MNVMLCSFAGLSLPEEDPATVVGNEQKKLVKIGRVGILLWRYANGQTQTHIAVPLSPTWCGLTSLMHIDQVFKGYIEHMGKWGQLTTLENG